MTSADGVTLSSGGDCVSAGEVAHEFMEAQSLAGS
jgi:hypothetical protein